MATLYVLSGFPGSGKSTWAKSFLKEHPNTHIVSSDEIRRQYFGSTDNLGHEKEVWEIFLNDLLKFGKEEDGFVIADCTNLTNYFRRYYYEMTPGYPRHILVMVDTPFELSCERNVRREACRVVPPKAMERLHNDYEPLSQEVASLYDEVIHVNP